MDNDPWDDLHPYYKRKAEKEAEMIDAMIVVGKYLIPLLLLAGFIDWVMG